jgi:AcrR family transcriptional regulator
MGKIIQRRTLETRASLIAAANALVAESGYEALRVEEVVRRAGVAKGTFFAHFRDKDTLMDLLIDEQLRACLDRIEALPGPRDTDQLVVRLMPLLELMASERCVFDVILRCLGSVDAEETGPVAKTFDRLGRILAGWLENGAFRRDVPMNILVEGIQALAIQAMTLNFCTVHNRMSAEERFRLYLRAWLAPQA